MIIYEINAKVRLDLVDEFEKYMRDEHIGDVLKTGYFENAEMAKIGDGVYRIRYIVKDRETLEQYFKADVQRLREEFVVNLPEGIKISREILEVLFEKKAETQP